MTIITIQCSGSRELPLVELIPFQGDLKELPDVEYRKLRAEMIESGFSAPFFIWEGNGEYNILDGHQRHATLLRMKEEGVLIPSLYPVADIFATDILEAKRKLLSIASSYGKVTVKGLSDYLSANSLGFEALAQVSFPTIDLEEVKSALDGIETPETDEGPNEDDIPDLDDAIPIVSRTGDIWLLGDHKLMCGSSTSKVDIHNIIYDEKADMIFTDPPYGVSYADKNEFLNANDGGSRQTKKIENDSKTPLEMYSFWVDAFSQMHLATKDSASYYVTSPQGGDLLVQLMLAIQAAGFQLKHTLCWVKNNHVLGRCDYNYKHEPILYGWKQKQTHHFYGDGSKNTSVWDFPKPQKSDLHPTMKPVALVKEAIYNSCLHSGIVLDPFVGSGTTILACEQTKTRCRAIEIDPYYVDVSIRRYILQTGKSCTLEGTDKTFDQIEQERAI